MNPERPVDDILTSASRLKAYYMLGGVHCTQFAKFVKEFFLLYDVDEDEDFIHRDSNRWFIAQHLPKSKMFDLNALTL